MRARNTVVAVLTVACLLLPASAAAGRRPFIWTWDTEVVPQGDVELEQWTWARSPNALGSRADYWVWWGPVIGITNQLELALPFQLQASDVFTWLEGFDVDVRYRLFDRNDEGPLQMLFRGAYHHVIHAPGIPSRFELNAVASYGAPDALHFTADLGLRIHVPAMTGLVAPTSLTATYAAGVATPVSTQLRVALEVFGQVPLGEGAAAIPAAPQSFVGPSLAWTRGRFWLTFGVLVGLTPALPDTPYVMPRLIWAVVL